MQERKVNFISLASVLSAIAVVYLHANGCFWEFSETARYWKTANIIECFFYFAVPVFFMISGATLMDFYDRYDLKTYFKKRISKTVIPYIFWSFFGLAFQVFYNKAIAPQSVSVKFVIKGLLNGSGIIGIYWFFIPLFCLYLSIPLFAAVRKEMRTKVFSYLVIVGFVINALIPFLIHLVKPAYQLPTSSQYQLPINLPVVSGYLLWIPLGYLLTHCDIDKKKRYAIYLLGIAGFLLHCIGTYVTSMKAGTIISTFKGYNNVPCILNSVAVFVFFRYGGQKLLRHEKIRNLIGKLAPYTFSLYLLHWYVLTIFTKHLSRYAIGFRLVFPLVITLIVVVITKLLRKIPGVHYLLP